jgi:hypothetical protein
MTYGNDVPVIVGYPDLTEIKVKLKLYTPMITCLGRVVPLPI